MALQTKTISYGDFYYGSVTRGYVLDLILTEESTDQVANTSIVSFKFQLRSGPANRFTDGIACAVRIADQVFSLDYLQIWAAYNTTYTLLTGELTVPHREDGTLELEASASVDTPESNPYAPPDLTFSGTMTLTPIPRASTLAATAAFIGDAATIVVSRKSADYTHSIFYEFGGISGYLADAVGTHADTEVKLTDTTVLFPVPESFYYEIPDSPASVCKLTCRTYSGDAQIGDAQIAAFTVTADPARCSPVVGGAVLDINEATLALTGDDHILVQGISTAQCTVEADVRKGATLSALYINGSEIESALYTIVGVSTATITFRAVDSRGYSTEYVVPGLSLVPYIPLSFNVSAARTDPTSGKATLSAQGKWFGGSFGKEQNALTAAYRIAGGEWMQAEAVVGESDLTISVALTGLDYQQSHVIALQLSDAINTLTKTVTVSKGIPVFDWGENDFVFHVPVRFTAADGTVFTLDLADGQLTAIT